MSGPLELHLDDHDRLVEPPIVDFLHLEPADCGVVVTFVPHSSVSKEPKEVAVLRPDSAEWRRVRAYLGRIENTIAPGAKVWRVAHSGGGNFSFHLSNGRTVALAGASLTNSDTQVVSDDLQRIAESAQATFVIQRRTNAA